MTQDLKVNVDFDVFGLNLNPCALYILAKLILFVFYYIKT